MKHKNQTKNTQQSKDNKRWRPRKEFVLKPKTSKRTWPGRPKKQEARQESGQEKKLKEHLEKAQKSIQTLYNSTFQENKRKDISIFIVFLASLGVFVFSLYITYKKQHPIALEIPSVETIKNTEIIPAPELAPEQTLHATSLENNNTTISARYTALNKQDRTTAFSLIDPKLRQSSTFKTYFNQKRLNRFISNLTEAKIAITSEPASEQTLNATSLNATSLIYTITYTLTNQQTFSEQRSATLVSKDGQERIAKLQCITTGCSRMPFFNPGKYQIK